MKFIVAMLIVLLAIGGGGALGIMLKPAPEPASGQGEGAREKGSGHAPTDMDHADAPGADAHGDSGGAAPAYVKIARQMIIPVVEGGKTQALMVFEIALDVPEKYREEVFEREPRLRDAFLREMFEMSHTGAFLETYTSERVMEELREKLLAAARVHLGARVSDVLILDALRQEL